MTDKPDWNGRIYVEHHASCSKCGGQLEKGFIVDHTGAKFARRSSWKPGDPKKSFWSGIDGENAVPVDTFRCTSCGYLESYAHAPKQDQ
jgi:hypothetical protein